MTLSLVKWPDPRLTKKCRPVTDFDDALAATAEEMKRLMVEEGGIGLAAPQVGLNVRMFVTAQIIDGPTVFVNPVVTVLKSGMDESNEGCLSLPGVRGWVRRPVSISVEAQHVTGERFRFDIDAFAHGLPHATKVMLMARCVEHESDHLDGKLMLDRIDPASRLDAIQEMRRGKPR